MQNISQILAQARSNSCTNAGLQRLVQYKTYEVPPELEQEKLTYPKMSSFL
jgi:hypothetical protein